MSVRVIIVDDEPLARRRLRRLLKVHEDVEVTGEATNGDEAVSAALEAHPDVLFMDVRMPGSDGLQALRKLRDKLPADVMPLVIFTTAYEEHAVEAFELLSLRRSSVMKRESMVAGGPSRPCTPSTMT